MSQEKQTAEEIACKKYSIKEGLNDYEENHFNSTNVNLAKAFIEGYEYATLKLQEKDKELFMNGMLNADLASQLIPLKSKVEEQAKEIERLKGENELLLKRCTKLSVSKDEIHTLLHPFAENNLTEEEIQAILSWYNDNH